jgi:hypothetical protein
MRNFLPLSRNYDAVQVTGSANDERPAKAPPKNVLKLQATAKQILEEADSKRAEAAEAEAEAERLQTEHAHFQREADKAHEQLITADAQCGSHEQSITTLLSRLVRAWGRHDGFGVAMQVPSYDPICSLERAITHYKEHVRPQLLAQLKSAETALNEFERLNLS